MKPSQTQYVVIYRVCQHLRNKIAEHGSPEEIARFKEAMESFLDTLADLLNDPKVAKAWDEEVQQMLKDAKRGLK